MKRVLTAVILIPIVVLALFRAPLWLFTLLVLGVALLAAREYFDIAEKTGFRPMRGLACLLIAASFVSLAGFASLGLDIHSVAGVGGSIIASLFAGLPFFTIVAPLLFLIRSLTSDPLPLALPSAAVSYLALPYLGFTMVALPLLRTMSFGALYLLFLMVLVWCGDIAAYYVGRAIGKRKLAPRISPGKTWEGSVASIVGAVIFGTMLFHFINPIAAAFRNLHLLASPTVKFGPPIPNLSPTLPLAPIWFVTVFAICVNVAAQLGDLVESALKRGAGMKDSGTLLPGHGGVLDRIDALLFALPVGLLFYAFGMSRYFELRGIQ